MARMGQAGGRQGRRLLASAWLDPCLEPAAAACLKLSPQAEPLGGQGGRLRACQRHHLPEEWQPNSTGPDHTRP